jgi:tRNA(fMet)-specific endonuclease VapC
MYLLDTDHISVLQLRMGHEFATLSARINRVLPSDLAFSIVSFHEQVLGLHTYVNRAKTGNDVVRAYEMMTRLLRDYTTSPALPFDAAASALFNQFRSQRIRLGTMDLRIATVALSNRLVLLTKNATDFSRVPGLATENWTV